MTRLWKLMSKRDGSRRPLLDQPANSSFNKLRNFEPVELYTSRLKNIIVTVGCLVLATPFALLLTSDKASEIGLTGVIFIWAIVILFGGCAPLVLISTFVRQGKIVIDRDGLHVVRLSSTSSWPWSEIGPINIDEVVFHTRGFTHKSYYICAFTDANHDLLAKHDRTLEPSHENADICIPVIEFGSGAKHVSPQYLENALNQWRDKFGRPDIEVAQHLDDSDARKLAQKIKFKTYLYGGILLILCLLLLGWRFRAKFGL